jgi:MarR family 2-MHQ and catechol resistance regulon transcriptional repressor
MENGDLSVELMDRITRTAMILEFGSEGFFKKYQTTRVQFFALYHILAAGEEGISLSGLGERMAVSKANITTLADRMETAALIQRISHRKDRRSTLVVITEKGRQCVESIMPERLKMAKEVFACLSPQEMKAVHEILMRIQTSLRNLFKSYV